MKGDKFISRINILSMQNREFEPVKEYSPNPPVLFDIVERIFALHHIISHHIRQFDFLVGIQSLILGLTHLPLLDPPKT
jgi:hypothetical protein